MKVLVWSERATLAVQLRSFAGGAMAFASPAFELAWFEAADPPAGFETVYGAAGARTDADWIVAALAETCRSIGPDMVLLGATKLGLEVAPRLAERLGIAYGPWATTLAGDRAAGFQVDGMSFAGAAVTHQTFSPGQLVATISTSVASAAPELRASGLGAAVQIEVAAPPARIEVLEERPRSAGGDGLESARVVVDVGQGVRERADLSIVESLAAALSASLACSRPVAADREWFPEWLGLSGSKVHPDLCITVGVSGAVQHIVGIRDSRLVVAINNDESAPIFAQSDIGVLADLYEFVPALVRRLAERKARPVDR